VAEPTPADQSRPQPVLPVPFLDRDRPGAPLPAPLTSFVGRERDVAAVVDLLLRDNARLVTLTGPGGVGKTRLALRVAEGVAAEFADGVAFADLTPLTDPALVAPTVETALGVREAGDRPASERLAAALRDRHLLLVLDNFERVVDAAPMVAGLLAACPCLTVVATSREPLLLSAERVFAVPPLAVPAPGTPGAPWAVRHPARPAVELAESDAVRLFAERARAAKADFVVNAVNAPVVAAICARLDGLPLAIELAAARVKVLPIQALLDRLERALLLLTGGGRDLPARQQTMRNAVAWSHDLLTPEEQALFRRLAVFAAGFVLEAAEAVAGGPDDLDRDVFDGVASLVDKSLLQLPEGSEPEPRYRMLETVREFGLEQLADTGEQGMVRGRHAAWCLALAERAAEALDGPLRGAWLGRLEAEHDNLRAALAWFDRTGDASGLLRLAGFLWRFWYFRGHVSEGRAWGERALAGAADEPASNALARALLGVGALRWQSGETDTAAVPLQEALTLYRAQGDRTGTAWTLNVLGCLISDNGDLDRGVDHLREALAIFIELGDTVGRAQVEGNLAEDAFVRGDFALAAQRLEAVLALQREIGDTAGAMRALTYLGNAVLGQGDLARAHTLLAQAATALLTTGYVQAVPDALRGLARAASGWGDATRAATVFGAEEALRSRLGVLLPPAVHRGWLERDVAALRQALGDAAFTAAWEAGRALSLGDAVALAAAPVDPTTLALAPTTDPLSTGTSRYGLSPRELEVLRLLAEGRTDREIGEALFISPRTVSRHLQNIYAKLQVNSRSAASALAHRHGLA
jgi:non-specific serine/threonine protein kinase